MTQYKEIFGAKIQRTLAIYVLIIICLNQPLI